MASRSQMRLAQLTGSFGTGAGQINQAQGGAAVSAIVADDLSGVLSHLAASIQRIHGDSDFSNQVEGQFDTVKFDVNTAGAITMDAASASEIATSAGAITVDGFAGVDLQHNGSSKLEVASAEVTLKTDLMPSAQSSHDLGSAAFAYAEVHATNYYGTGSFRSVSVGDLTEDEIVIAGGADRDWETDLKEPVP